MLRLFLIHSLRYFSRHRLLTALNIVGIALGVAVFVSVQVVNHSALQSFRASVDIVAGKANFQVTADGLRFDEKIYTSVRQHPDVLAATPVVEEVCIVPQIEGEYLHVLGVDVFSNGPLRTFGFRDRSAQLSDPMAFLNDLDAIVLTEAFCQRHGLKIGDHIDLATAQGTKSYRIAFLFKFDDDMPGADEHLAVMDIANLQENFRHAGKLNRIDALLKPGADPSAVAASLRGDLPANVTAGAPDRRGKQIERMISAFQLNLTALSLVSLLVGMFLIYNTVATAVVRRRTEIGILRALGLTPRQVQVLFVGEAMVLGIAGLILGLILGVLLAGQLVGVVSKNITSLYILLSIREIFVAPEIILAAVILGLGAVGTAAWYPAWEASRLPPVQALGVGFLQEKSRSHTGLWLLLAVAFFLLAAAAGAGSLYGGPPWLSFGAALGTMMGAAFCVPAVSQAVAEAWRPRGVVARLAVEHFGRSLHRNSLTIAALVTALAMVVSISTMIFSFRRTVETWLYRSVQADLLIAPAAGLVVGPREVLRPEVEEVVKQAPGVQAIDGARELRFPLRGQIVKLLAIRFPISARYSQLSLMDGRASGPVLEKAARDGDILVSESFSNKFHVKTGDVLEVPSTTGVQPLRIAGTFSDYTTEFGMILMDETQYRRLWKDADLNSLALYCAPGTTARDVQDWLRPRLAPYGQYLVLSNQELRQQVFRIFDQTFAVTYVLQTVGILVSAIGICLGLSLLVTERQREIGILRAVGASRGQVRGMVLIEATLIAVVGTVLAISAGLALAAVLSFVINMAFFGWTIQWATPWNFLLTLPLWVLAAALAAALWPAWQASKVEIASAVKME